MLASLQVLVRRRYYPLVMLMTAAGFLLILLELFDYRHFGGLQMIGTASVALGLVATLLGINARGRLRQGLIYLLLALSLVGLLGIWEHNEDRLGGERQERAGQTGGAQNESAQTGGTQAGGAQTAGDGDQQSGPGGQQERIPPPILAPLSVSGLCLFGAVALLRRDDDE